MKESLDFPQKAKTEKSHMPTIPPESRPWTPPYTVCLQGKPGGARSTGGCLVGLLWNLPDKDFAHDREFF
jgi:hypothetical protein